MLVAVEERFYSSVHPVFPNTILSNVNKTTLVDKFPISAKFPVHHLFSQPIYYNHLYRLPCKVKLNCTLSSHLSFCSKVTVKRSLNF